MLMKMQFIHVIYVIFGIIHFSIAQFGGEFPPECDLVAAARCEYDFLQCRLFTGPADDAVTMCICGEVSILLFFRFI